MLEILPPQAEKLRTDSGSEYKGELDTELRKRGVHHFRTTNEKKANFAERMIRSLKSLIFKYMEQNGTHTWVGVLDSFTSSYNHSNHRSIDATPFEAWHNLTNAELWSRQYLPPTTVARAKPKKLPRERSGFKFSVGDHVKLHFLSTKFDRAYHQSWTSEFFTIITRKKQQSIPVYKVKDYRNEVITGWFYEAELQKVLIPEDRSYKIDKILKTKRRGDKTFYLVSWVGWPSIFDSWIDKSQLEKV